MVDDKIKKRKLEHIEGFLKTYECKNNGFEEVQILNNSLPEIDYHEVTLKSTFLGKEIKAPIMINAITGGSQEMMNINIDLAKLAKEFGIPMAVGSQSVGLKFPECTESFKCVRDIIGDDGVIISNLSANRNLDDVRNAVAMIHADAIQLHMNALQELCMEEGDRNFKGLSQNIKEINDQLGIPVIAKEVGFGISYKTAIKLRGLGVEYLDISGNGGTNFVQIEDSRYESDQFEEFADWGINTAQSLMLVKKAYPECHAISSGGIRRSRDVVKSLIMGAEIVGISGALLNVLLKEGFNEAREFLGNMIKELKIYMTILGIREVEEFKNIDYILHGDIRELSKVY